MRGILYTLQLSNGLTVVAEQIDSGRSAAYHLLVPAGAVTDPDLREGTGTVLEGLCYRGAGSRSSRELSDALDALGLHRGGGADLEYATFGGALLADDLHRALELYADIVRRPALPEDQVAPERDLALQKLTRLQDNPADRLFVNLRRAYYASPHGRTPLGTEEGLRACNADSLRSDHLRRYRPGGAILAIAGRFAWDELHATIHRLFADWEGAAPPIPAPVPRQGARYEHIIQDTNQEQIGIMYPSIPLGHPDYYSMRMAVEVLSGGMSARLFMEVREKRGLCYAVRASHHNVRGAGSIVAYAGTTPERCQETLDVLVGELRRLEEGVSWEELVRARTGVLSSLVMQSEATRARASSLSRDQFLLGQVRTMDEIREGVQAVTPDSIREYLKAHPLEEFTLVTLGPKELEVAA